MSAARPSMLRRGTGPPPAGGGGTPPPRRVFFSHPLAQDVLVHLGGTTLDRVGPAAQHPAHLVGEVVLVRIAGALPGGGRRAEQLGGEQLDALVEPTLVDLADRALGAGRAPGP